MARLKRVNLGWLLPDQYDTDGNNILYIDSFTDFTTMEEANVYFANKMGTLNPDGVRYTEGNIQNIDIPDPTPDTTPELSPSV
jgi:hypothetical protein